MINARSLAGICLLLALSLLPAAVAGAECDLQVRSAGPCLSDGNDGIPHVGDNYGVKVVVRIVGGPATFRIKWTLANVTQYSEQLTRPAGEAWWWYINLPMDLDGPIPWSVTLDPDGTSGDSNPNNNSASGTFIPFPPQAAVELYAPRTMTGSQTRTLAFQSGSGTIPFLHVLFGVPTTHGAQRALSVSGPPESRQVVTQPYDLPILELSRLNVPAATFTDTETFTVQLHRVRVNQALLRKATWAGLDGLAPEWKRWLAPDQRVQSTDALVTAFVQQSLPADYRTTLTPYDAARTLHQAVIKKLKYESPHRRIDAVGVLQLGATDCGGYAALLTACLRNIGIPARCISGFREGESVWHVRMEFHLPGFDWIVADPCDGDSADPGGTYAYSFGNIANADRFVAVDVGDSHIMPYHDFPFMQLPHWWWGGGAQLTAEGATASLHPGEALTENKIVSAATPQGGEESTAPQGNQSPQPPASRILLKNGKALEGTILKKGTHVVIKTAGATVTIPQDKIGSITN